MCFYILAPQVPSNPSVPPSGAVLPLGAPILVYAQLGPSVYPNYFTNGARLTGICQLISGLLAIILQVAGIICECPLSTVAQGIWIGAIVSFYIIL